MTPRPAEEPRLDLVVPCWRMRGPSGHVLSCAIYRTDMGLEVRCGYAQDLLRSQRVVDVREGHSVAEQFRRAVCAKGGFEELPVGGNAMGYEQ
jgi:hypothetical protein